MTSQRLLSQLRQCAIATLGAVSLAGCMVGPDFVKPENGLREVVLTPRQDHPSAPLTSDAAVPSQWWLLFNDAVLAELQSRAQADNLDLLIASERIEQSRAQLGIASSQLLPSVAANASYTREGQ